MSLRQDLMVLTTADLADISNRGTVKRASKELDKGTITCELDDQGGSLTLRWSDGPTCHLPAGRTIADSECDCPAPAICRHLIRSVLAYQQLHAETLAENQPPAGPWNPGDIVDAVLEDVFSSRQLNALRTTYSQGLVVEVLRGIKPLARFHKLRHTVRFLVPGDVRYSQCDCSEKAPCRHAALAVWAFRELVDAEAGIITTGEAADPLDDALLSGAEDAVRQLLESGVSNTPAATMDRLRSWETRLRDANVVWPAEILADLRRQYDHYHSHDARFSPDTLADLVGELVIRLDALRSDDLPVPELFVRGHRDDQDAKLGQSRLIGLGCGVRNRQNSVEILALMQDDSSGMVAAVSRHFPDPPNDEGKEPEDFARLGSKLVVKGRDLTTLGAGQLVIKTGKLYSDHRLSLGRSTASVYAQNYTWEDLRAPVHAEGFAEVRARLAQLPPASLRPRRLGEDMQVVSIREVGQVRFSSREQAVRATMVDHAGDVVQLRHPYTTRNRNGTERLLNWLQRAPEKVRFVCGPHRLSSTGLVVSPTGVVFEGDSGRFLVQPWVDDMDAHLESSDVHIEPPRASEAPLDLLRNELAAITGDAFLMGVDNMTSVGLAPWERLESLSEGLQLHTIAYAIDRLRTTMQQADHHAMSLALLDVALLSRLAQELG